MKDQLLDREEILNVVRTIAYSYIEEDMPTSFSDGRKVLHIILSESSQAVEFVSCLEDEFEIEFDDDQINLDFFSDFEIIVDCIIDQIGV